MWNGLWRFLRSELASYRKGLGWLAATVWLSWADLVLLVVGAVIAIAELVWLLFTHQPRFRRRLRQVLQSAGRRWRVARDRWAALRPTWLATLITFGVSILLLNGQALDALAETGPSKRICLFFAVVVLALVAWYFSRALLYVRYPRITPKATPLHDDLRRWAPRVLGVTPILFLAAAYSSIGSGWPLSLFYLLVALVFWRLLINRQKLLKLAKPPSLERNLPKVTFWVALVVQGLSLLGLFTFLFWKVGPAQALGPIGILLLAAAMWISFGSLVLIYPTYRYGMPSGIVLLLLLAGIFSLWNDNHQVRVCDSCSDEVSLEEWRQPLAAHLREWKALRGLDGDLEEAYPIFVVAAEGGGIRAAYWTAALLAQLEDEIPGFACHLFAISGVSGGSLGGAVFASLVAELVDQGLLRCDRSRQIQREDRDRLAPKAHQVLGHDFLAPTLAGMLFPDVVQRFWPIPNRGPLAPLALPDRASYLEGGWESAYYLDSERRRVRLGFARPFRNLWAGDRREHQVPSLFLNGTWVENGGRVVTTNLLTEVSATGQGAPGPADAAPDGQVTRAFVRLDDMLGCLGKSIRLSTAVHMSARFTYVSPAGTVRVADPSRCPAANARTGAELHVVDGGYFENSGGHTAAEIVDRLRQLGWQGEIYSLIVSNNPKNPNAEEAQHYRQDEADDRSHGRVAFGETLSPVFALLNTRSARGFYAEAYLASHVDGNIRFQLTANGSSADPEEATFPLGWTLSPGTERRIRDQASGDCSILEVCEIVYSQSRCAAAEQKHAANCEAYGADTEGCAGLEQLIGECRTRCNHLRQELSDPCRISGTDKAPSGNSTPSTVNVGTPCSGSPR